VALTFTGLVVGHAVIMKRGVLVAVRVVVEVVDGNAVTMKRGVPVIVFVEEKEGDAVRVGVAVKVIVEDAEMVDVAVVVGGSAEGLTDATSLPTVKSTPHTCGRDSVAE